MSELFSIRKQSSALAYHVGAFIATAAWGASFISTKVLLQHGLTAVEIYIYRCLLAYICMLVMCPKPLFARSLGDELKLVLVGVCGGSIYFIAENTAVDYTLVTNVSLIVTLAPLLAAILMGILYKNERPSRGFYAGSVLAFLGVAFVIFNSSLIIQVNPLGDMLSLLAAVCFAIYTVILRPLNAVYSSWFITRKTFFYGLITALPFLGIEPELGGLSVLLEWEVLLNFLFLGLVASMLAFLLYAQAVKRLGVITAGNYLYISPIVTFVLSAWVLHEPVTIVGVIGCLLILAGVIISDKFSHN